MRPFHMRIVLFVAVIVSGACGGCGDDELSEFFEPTEFGTYEFEPAPDIDAPTVVDFGEVERGRRARRDLPVSNLGRLPLTIDGLVISDDRFDLLAGRLVESPVIEARDTVPTVVEFEAPDQDPVHATLDIASNDPDEPIYTIVLLANRLSACAGSFQPGAPVWQVHPGEGPVCWPTTSRGHGHEAEYDFSEIPAADDTGWVPEPDNHISFEQRSTLCGTDCACRGGGDFTYFQTFLYVPARGAVRRYVVDIRNVDDGARVTVFNERFPDGGTDPASYARIPGGSSADLAPYLVAGLNRIVITHVDDCCSVSRIRDVVITADGDEVQTCDP